MDAIINAVQAKKDYSAIADRVCKERKRKDIGSQLIRIFTTATMTNTKLYPI